MSYSISVRAPNKAEAKAQLLTKFAEATASQPFHEADKTAALCAARSFLDLLPDDDTKDVCVRMAGSVSIDPLHGPSVVSADFTCSVCRVERDAK